MQKNHRSGRLGEEIRKIISTMLLRGDLKDPDINPLTSITAVDVTSDGSYATVYLSIMGSEEEKKATISAFKRGAGYIRNNIGKAVKIRHIPELTFKIDSSLEYGMHISKIIDELKRDEDKGGDETDDEE